MPQSDMSGSSDLQSKIQSALQQNNLSGVSVNATDKGVELTGTANSHKERKEAVRIAKENAGGKKVIDHIQVSKNGASRRESTTAARLGSSRRWILNPSAAGTNIREHATTCSK